MKYALLPILLILSLLAASCTVPQKSQCNLASDCPKGKCPDGYGYNKFECISNKCSELVFFADPCLNHYPEEKECSSDSECSTGGCSSQLCGKKGSIEKAITTCDFKEEYSCLKSLGMLYG